MAKGLVPYVSFNGGEIGQEVLSRTAIENYGATASILENIYPEAAGPMSKRPGLAFQVELGAEMYLRKWVYGVDQKYIMAFGDNTLKIIQDGGVIVRPAVSSAITNGDFASAMGTGWNDASDNVGLATISGGLLRLAADGARRAIARQQVTTSSPGLTHALNISVLWGAVTLRIGSSSGGVQYIDNMVLRTGTHSIAFVPVGTYWIDLWSTEDRLKLVSSCVVAPAGDLTLTTPWLASNFTTLRFQQSKDVVYVAGVEGVNKRRIERHGSASWSLVLSDEQDGPFETPNTDSSLTLQMNVTHGNGTLTCNRNYFDAGHVGALFQITQNGQVHTSTLVGGNQWTEPIKLTGSGDEGRTVRWTVTGTWTGTLTVQDSMDGISWSAMQTGYDGTQTTTSNGSYSFNDHTSSTANRDNIPYYYRIGFKAADYTSGFAVVRISTDSGAQTGIVRVTGYTSGTSCSAEILKEISATTATAEWTEGAWSGVNGYPRAVALFDDRLWNGYLDKYWASQSSLYEIQETGDKDGDAIWRSISTGEVGKIQWILPLSRVVIGTDAAEDVIRSSAFDDPITPSNITVRDISSWGSADVEPEKVDARGLFIDRSTIHAMEIAYSADVQDYVAKPLTRLHRDIGRPGLGQICLSRRPETRLYIVRKDGQALTKLYDPQENVLGWSHFITPGSGAKILSIESIPGSVGTGEDEVYFVVKRRISGVYRYYYERLGNFYNTTAADANCLDSYVRYDGRTIFAVAPQKSHVLRASDFSGNADGKKGMVSFWVKFTDPATDASPQTIYVSGGGYFSVSRTSAGKWQIIGNNSAATPILNLTSSKTYGSATGWHHVMASWDLATGRGQLYINGNDDLAPSPTLTNDTIDYTRASHFVFYTNLGEGVPLFSAAAAEIYLNVADSLDLSVAANREKFISSSRRPVDLNADGTAPTGNAPIVYLTKNADAYATNSGTGGNFTLDGWLDDAVPPSMRYASQTKTFSGLAHLEGQTVAVWADGVDVGDYVVSSAAITLLVQPSQVAIGLNYVGRYQSSRIAMQASDQGQLTQLQHITLLFSRSTRRLMYGSDFVDMDDARTYGLADGYYDPDGILETGISESLTIPGDKRRDPRLCITMPRPDPVTLAGYTAGQDVNQIA